jgi:RNA-directed DNA polymerase
VHRQPRLKVAPESVRRLKAKLRLILRPGRGRALATVIRQLTPIIRGWTAYFRLAGVKGIFEDLDQWLRHKLRSILWRQWKRPRFRYRELCRRGLDAERAAASAFNGRGPWWNAGASHMNHAVPAAEFRRMGLTSFVQEHQRLAQSL